MTEQVDPHLIEAAIDAQEQLRGSVDDAIVDAAIGALRAQIAGSATESPGDHERRLVTALFLDVVESTRILQGVDPEEAMGVMDTALRSLARPADSHGGRIVTYTGDGFLAVFGLRRTREDDAEMAVRAGLDMLDAARAVAHDAARTHGIEGFDVRIGINSGLVATGGSDAGSGLVSGSAINLAARIESAAPPGGLFISQSTYRQVRGRFDLEPAGTIDAKGFPDPVPVHRVISRRRDESATGFRGFEHVDVPMVGRDEQLRVLERSLDEVATDHRALVVTVTGDAGVGKSRLLAEFERRALTDRSVTTLRARASLESAEAPFALLRDLVERRFSIRSTDAPESVTEKLAAGLGPHLSEGSDRSAKVHTIGTLLGYRMTGDPPPQPALQPQQLRDRTVLHLTEFLSSVAEPVVLLLDDLQWADGDSLDVLGRVIDGLGTRSVLTVALTRPTASDALEHWAKATRHRTVSLEPLDNPFAETLIDHLLARLEKCPPELRRQLLDQAGGIPYYLEELVLMCIDDGVIEVGDAAWIAHMDRFAPERLPPTLTGVIRARLDGLPDAEHAALQAASVCGRIFWDGAVVAMSGDAEPEAIRPRLSRLRERRLIALRSPSTFADTTEFAFADSILREATYEEILLADRRTHHGIVADWLIAVSGSREREFVATIAGHLEKSNRSREAVDYLTRAAESAWDGYAVTTAADFYRRALALTPDDDLERRYRLLLGLERAVALTGARDEQRRCLDQLEGLASSMGDAARQAIIAVERTFLHFSTSTFAEALASARVADERAIVAGDDELRSRALSALAWAHFYLGHSDEARADGEQALVIAARLGVSSEATAQNLLGNIAMVAGELSEARARLSRALAIAESEDDVDASVTYLNNLAVVLTLLGDYEAARDSFAANLERALEGGDKRSESAAHLNLAWVESARGAWDAARSHAERGIDLKRRHEHTEGEAEGLLWLGHALTGLGDDEAAESAYRASARIRQELGQAALALGTDAGLARVALARGDVSGAMGWVAPILDALADGESLDGTWEPLRIYLTAFDVLRAAGDVRAEQVLRRASDELEERSRKITDEADRHSYRHAVPWHHRIVELSAEQNA